ncbi:hypothetical protein JHK86_001504 [Glycine max]|nr:hypothetical protein JHK86_001504 [Glycine max]
MIIAIPTKPKRCCVQCVITPPFQLSLGVCDQRENLLSKKSRRKLYIAVGTVGRRKPYTALGIVVGAQSSKLSTLPVNKLIVLYVVFKLDESYTPSKVSILACGGFHNLKEIKTVELVRPTGWVYLSLSGAYPR